MGLNHFSKLTIFGSFGILCFGCQLLPPYKGPVAPTPDQWKTTYTAPDAGKPTIPADWKDKPEPLPQDSLPLTNHELDSTALIHNQTNTINSTQPENHAEKNDSLQESEPEPSPPQFDEVRRDLCNWWEVFQDDVLNQLEEQALNSSYTLWAALERVIEARAQAQTHFAPLLPNLSFTPSFSRTGILYQNPLPDSIASTTTVLPKAFRFVQTQYLVPLNLTYEIDLWGKLNNTYYASLIKAQAASQAYLSVLLSLTADIASTYFQMRGLDAQQAVVQRNIGVRQHALDLTRARYKAGLIVYLDVSRAEVELARAHSDSDDVRRLRGLQENILATLVGTPASIFSIAANPLIIPPPVIPRGLPSELLCRRPDIAEAERNLAAAYREIGVAYANFYPSFNLNTSLGFSSPFAHTLFSWQSRFWQVGWSIFQTVFDGGYNAANLDYYQARFRELLANYQQTVLKAFQDVEDSLVNLRGYADQAQDLAKAVQAARLTLELADMRYNRGLTNYLDVVDAERQLLETEQNSVIVLGNRYVSTVMLIRGLGGGWGPCETCRIEDEENQE